MHKIENWWLSIDKFNFIFIIALGITGVVLSFSINENFYLINRHTFFFILGLIILIFFSQLSDKNIRRISLLGFIIFLFLLILIIFLDYEIKGAKRWYKFFNFSLQPSEIINPFFIILTSWCISQSIIGKKNNVGRNFLKTIAICLRLSREIDKIINTKMDNLNTVSDIINDNERDRKKYNLTSG